MSASDERPIRVLVADDHELFRRGLAELLTEEGFEVVGQAGDGVEAVALAERRAPDVVVMDLRMPGSTGVDATAELTRRLPDVRVLMLTVDTDLDHVVEALLAGAVGYLVKDARVEDIVAGVRAAVDGDSVISPNVASSLVARLRRQMAVPAAGRAPAELSERELDVLRLVAEGRTNQEIADELVISAPTVKHHVAHVVRKLGVENRIQAAIEGVRRGLL